MPRVISWSAKMHVTSANREDDEQAGVAYSVCTTFTHQPCRKGRSLRASMQTPRMCSDQVPGTADLFRAI